MSCSRWPTLLFWTGFALLAAGMVFNAPWRAIAATPLAGLVVLGLISLALGTGIRRVFHTTRATAMLAVWVCTAFWFSGLASVLAALPLIVGSQLLLSWLNFDVAAEPRQPIHPLLRDGTGCQGPVAARRLQCRVTTRR